MTQASGVLLTRSHRSGAAATGGLAPYHKTLMVYPSSFVRRSRGGSEGKGQGCPTPTPPGAYSPMAQRRRRSGDGRRRCARWRVVGTGCRGWRAFGPGARLHGTESRCQASWQPGKDRSPRESAAIHVNQLDSSLLTVCTYLQAEPAETHIRAGSRAGRQTRSPETDSFREPRRLLHRQPRPERCFACSCVLMCFVRAGGGHAIY